MKQSLLAFLVFISCSHTLPSPEAGKKLWPRVSSSSPVILELFTSEGCSSCPAAETLLPELMDEDSVPVLGISFHVDYWDYLGWKDNFSKRQFSERQRAYGKAFGLSSIYTPQLVINGQYETVGSNRSKAIGLIQK